MPELAQRATHRQMGLLDQPDDLELLGGGVPHSLVVPSPGHAFFQQPVLQRQSNPPVSAVSR